MEFLEPSNTKYSGQKNEVFHAANRRFAFFDFLQHAKLKILLHSKTVKIFGFDAPKSKISRASFLVHRKSKIFKCPKNRSFQNRRFLMLQKSVGFLRDFSTACENKVFAASNLRFDSMQKSAIFACQNFNFDTIILQKIKL